MTRSRRIVLYVCIALSCIGIGTWLYLKENPVARPQIDDTVQLQSPNPFTPTLEASVVAVGLDRTWDVAVLSDDVLLVSERPGRISRVQNGNTTTILTISDIYAVGESGLMGLTLDGSFSTHRFVYACYATNEDIRVVRWRLDDTGMQLLDENPIVSGMPVNTTTFPGRHAGCRPRFGPDGYLWIGTGDVAIGTHPQNPTSLGGKILRVDRDGKPAPGNLGAPFDARIFSYGHRNVQGIAFAPDTAIFIGYSVEHGSDRDDEVNVLRKGNYGWDPVPGYNEKVDMTDLDTYPEALTAAWSSGKPTIAPSGATFIQGEQWGLYEGRLAVAVQKDTHLRLFEVDADGKIQGFTELFRNTYGRIRSVVQDQNGPLYITTDNGKNQDIIVKITPKNTQ